MTGKYIDFKGKLKVGDRVRLQGTIVPNIDGTRSWVDVDIGKGCRHTFHVFDESVLEFLSPSPRVISLETLEPGDEVERMFQGEKYLATCLDVSKNGIVKHMEETRTEGQERAAIYTGDVAWSTTARKMGFDGWQPVQPASPPAPAEKEEEWWNDKKYHEVIDLYRADDTSADVYDVPKIVAEAKRRGAQEAWKEAMRIAQSHTKFGEDGFKWIGHCFFINDVADKIESLNKPAGAGEK